MKVMGNNPSKYKGARQPVEKVRWNEAVEFCRKLSEQESEEYRLPTEAEWEYACRAGTTTAYSFGDDETQIGKYARYGVLSEGTNAIGQKLPNPWGLYDMHGNVWEWCQEGQGGSRVCRGGAFFNRPKNVRSACRYGYRPVYRGNTLGFRLARTYNLSP